ncbi:MAG: zinc ribbon domain-containing protein [Candidatus Hodarchaeota archaeon]
MVKTCQACDYKNEDDADFCARCGAHLQEIKTKPIGDKDCYGDEDQECFGLPHGGAICGIIIGTIIIVWGLSTIMGWDIWSYFWPLIFILFGILIVAGAIYAVRRRP